MSVRIQGIEELRGRLQRLQNLNNSQIALIIAEHGAELAQEEFGGESVSVIAESVGEGHSRITASGQQVAFVEYGTGIVGEGNYEGNLPTQNITFTARNGKEHTTNGWVYNYFVKEIDSTAKNHTGFVGRAPMWRTAQRLIDSEAKEAILQYLQSEGE